MDVVPRANPGVLFRCARVEQCPHDRGNPTATMVRDDGCAGVIEIKGHVVVDHLREGARYRLTVQEVPG